MTKPTVVVLSADEKFAHAASVAIWSVLSTTPHPVEISVIDSGLGDDAKRYISRVVHHFGHASISFPELPVALKDATDIPGRLKGSLSRLFIPTLIRNASRAIYLDCDVIVLKDISTLYSVDLQGAPIGAAKNLRSLEKYSVSNSRMARFFRRSTGAAQQEHARMQREIGAITADRYINSGVLVMDLEAMAREHECSQRLTDFRAALSKTMTDQDWLAHVFLNKIAYIHPRWNCYSTIGRTNLWAFDEAERILFVEAAKDPGIIHFVGRKPWAPSRMLKGLTSGVGWRRAWQRTARAMHEAVGPA